MGKSRFFKRFLPCLLLCLSLDFAARAETYDESTDYDIDLNPRDIPSDSEEIAVLQQAKQIYRKTQEYIKERRSVLGDEIFGDQAGRGNVVYTEKGLGQGKLTYIDGAEVVTVTLDRYKLAIPFLDIDKIDEDSDHLVKFIARQKRNRGRDVLLIKSSQGEVESIEFSPFHRFFSLRGLKDFWDSFREKPTRGNYALGAICGVYQGGLAVCLNVAQNAVAADGTSLGQAIWDAQPAALMIASFASFIGIFCGPYRNLVYEGTKLERTAKAGVITTAFAVSFAGLIKGWDYLDPTAFQGQMHLLSLALNVVVTNFTRDDWQQIVRANVQLRRVRGDLHLGKLDTGIPNKDVQNQAVYNFGALPFKLLDQIDFKVMGTPVGKVAFYLTLPVVRYYNKCWFERKYLAMRKQFKEAPTEELAVAIRRMKARLDEVEAAWKQMLKVGMYATLPLMKTLNKLWLEGRLKHLQDLYDLDPNPELRKQIIDLTAQVQFVNNAWQTLPGKIANAVKATPSAVWNLPSTIASSLRASKGPPRCGLTFANVDKQTINSIFND